MKCCLLNKTVVLSHRYSVTLEQSVSVWGENKQLLCKIVRSTENIQAKLKILQRHEEAVECNSCLKPVFHWPNLFAQGESITTAKFIFLHASSEQFAWCRKKYLCVYHILETILNGLKYKCTIYWRKFPKY